MPTILKIRKTYKYRLYHSQHDFLLHDQLNIAGIIWNHITALQRRYYRRFRKHITLSRMDKYTAKLRMRTQRFHYWRKLGSQAVQELCQRHENAYECFFNKKGGLPRFKKVKKFSSFVLKQAAWVLGEDSHKRGGQKHPKWTGHIAINGIDYKFVKHRPMAGIIKTVTIKRDAANRLWICFSVQESLEIEDPSSTGKSGGFDFGLRTFLTTNSGQSIEAPEFFKADLPRMRQIQKQVSKKVKNSQNQVKGKKHLARRHIRIADKRRDFHYQLAHELCKAYDMLVFEDLNIAAMKRLWGRKVSDLGFKQFLKILEWMTFKTGKKLILIDRWERTTGICSACGHRQQLRLDERRFCCEQCGFNLDRDHNAAKNILEAGHRLILSQSIEVHSEHHSEGSRRKRQKPLP
jgi:putative transposase